MKVRALMNLLKNVLISVFIGLLLFPQTTFSQKPHTRIAIFPFRINASQGLTGLQEGIIDMLSARLFEQGKVVIIDRYSVLSEIRARRGKDLNDELIQDIAKGLGVDYSIVGSVTQMGKGFSLDARVIEVKSGLDYANVSSMSNTIDDIIPQVDLLAHLINNKVFGKPVPKTSLRDELSQSKVHNVPSTLPLTQGKESTTTQREPEGGLKTGYQNASDYTEPRGVKPEENKEASFSEQPETMKKPRIFSVPMNTSSSALVDVQEEVWKSHELPFVTRGISIGDVDGDRENEIIVVSEDTIYIYKSRDNDLQMLKKIISRAYEMILSVDVCDINQNGKAEIFVSKHSGDVLTSLVIEYDGIDYSIIADRINYYLKAVKFPQEGFKLLGQEFVIDSTYKYETFDDMYGSIYVLEWDGNEYIPREKMNTPEHISLSSLVIADTNTETRHTVVALNRSGELVCYKDGELREKSKNEYGGSDNCIELDISKVSKLYKREFKNKNPLAQMKVCLNQRILAKDFLDNGSFSIFVAKNTSSANMIVGGKRLYNDGCVYKVSWDGSAFANEWIWRGLEGYISDIHIGDLDGDAKDELIVTLNQQQGSILDLFKKRSYLVALKMK
ncbi:MAG: FG-GAP-like repeat-containing protein [Thermodesulfobacteriota bacterium]|nr:FG-GAP-like repeat-containing protein [Thermodesulfobacteriota bacterium]